MHVNEANLVKFYSYFFPNLFLFLGFGTTMCLVIAVCNLAVVGALCRLSPQKVRRTTSSTSGRSNYATQEELSFARLMVALCVFFITCWLPQMVISSF